MKASVHILSYCPKHLPMYDEEKYEHADRINIFRDWNLSCAGCEAWVLITHYSWTVHDRCIHLLRCCGWESYFNMLGNTI
jgi:hypothetical protein